MDEGRDGERREEEAGGEERRGGKRRASYTARRVGGLILPRVSALRGEGDWARGDFGLPGETLLRMPSIITTDAR